MEVLHQKHGKLTWSDPFEDATSLALEGFELTSRTEE